MVAIVLSSAIVGPIAIAFVIDLVVARSYFACKFYKKNYNFTSFLYRYIKYIINYLGCQSRSISSCGVKGIFLLVFLMAACGTIGIKHAIKRGTVFVKY